MNFKSKKNYIFIILIIIIMMSSYAYAESSNNDKKVYVVVANKLTLEDITQMNTLKKLIDEGSLGLMNTRGTNNANSSEGFITINASSRSFGRYDYSTAFNLTGDNLFLYKTRVGFIEDNQYKIGNIEINRIIDENTEKSYNSTIGALGDNIHSAGLKTAVFGNSDINEKHFRMGSLIAMDSRGLIDYGDVDNVLIKDKSYPYGIRTDYKKILDEIEKIKKKASLIVIDTGDLSRLASYNKYLNDEMFNFHRKNMLDKLDGFLENLVNNIDNNSMIMVISPNLEKERLMSSSLSPVILWSTEENQKSILTSGTTRRDGIVANIDVAPTIARFLNVPVKNFIGHNMTAKNIQNNTEFINKLDAKTNIISNLRTNFLTVYNIITIITILIFIILLFSNQISSNKLTTIVENMSLIIILIPIVLLMLPLLNIQNQIIYIISTVTMLVLTSLFLKVIERKSRMWTLIVLIFTILVLDIVSGSNLTKNSIIGYDPIIGARYFGIGNELVGVLLTSTALVTTLIFGKVRYRWPLIMLVISTILIGHPSLGANVGGTISILFTAMIYILTSEDLKINFKRLILIGSTISILIVLIGFLDLTINDNPTHLGKTFLMIDEKGPLYLIDVIVRKIHVNIKLVKTSNWSKVLYICLIFISIMNIFFKENIKEMFKRYKYLDSGVASILSGSIVGFLLNDSGLLLSAIAISFLVAFIMYDIIICKKTM